MSVSIVPLVNAMKPRSFLELGTWNGENFRAIECESKVSVDINGLGTFTGTTDEFFFQNARRFDVCFVDACHDLDFVVRDFNNAILCCDRAIILHDMLPPSRRHTKRTECSDSYKLLLHFWRHNIPCGVLDHDCGLTVVRKEHFIGVEDVADASYDDLLAELPNHRLLTLEELIAFAA